MSHIRTKIRNAVISVLRDEFGDKRVFSSVRLSSKFQTDNFPVVLVGVSESLTPDDEPPGGRAVTRDVSIHLKIGERAVVENADTTLDDIASRIEVLLASPEVLDIGKCWNWNVGSIDLPQFEAVNEGKDVLIASEMKIDLTLRTLDSDPSTNLNP